MDFSISPLKYYIPPKSARCVYCGKRLTVGGSYCHPFWKSEIMCYKCCNDLPVCICCERHVPFKYQAKQLCNRPSICASCQTLGVVCSPRITLLVNEALNLLTEVSGLNFNRLGQVMCVSSKTSEALTLAAKRRLFKSSQSMPATTFGICCCSNTETVKSKKLTDLHLDIYILDCLSPLLFGAFLCHEIIHAAIYCLIEIGPRFLSLESAIPALSMSEWDCNGSAVTPHILEEGMCHLAAACWLMSKLHWRKHNTAKETKILTDGIMIAHANQAQFWLRKFFFGKHPEFSIGFHAAKKTVEKYGWGDTLKSFASTSQ